jgi:hypothetical protein
MTSFQPAATASRRFLRSRQRASWRQFEPSHGERPVQLTTQPIALMRELIPLAAQPQSLELAAALGVTLQLLH